MSTPAIASSASPAASTNPFLSLSAQGGVTSLFLNFLTSGNIAVKKATDGDGASTTLLGKNGVSLEPTLLVLPQGIANLSDEDLKNLLANSTNTNNEQLGNNLLLALTPGTPAAQAIADFLAQLGKEGKIAELNQNQQTALTTSTRDALTQGNILLVATGLAPADIEQLKEFLSGQNDNTANDLALQLNSTDEVDATDATAVALVMFIPPALQNTLKDLNDDGTDILLPINNKNLSGVTISNDADAANNGKHLGAYISPFTSDGHSKFSAETSDENAEEGFTGSLASANSNQSREAKLSLEIASKLDSKATGLGLDSLQTWKMDTASSFSTSSLLSANGAGLATGQSPLTNPLISNPSAAGTHPATQMVAAMIEKAAQSGSEKAQQELSIQLDPPELGRVQVHLSYEKGEAMKVHLTTEKQETLSLLQRDSHALKAALEQAGVQTDGSSLSFDMAGSDQSFNQLLGQGRDNQHSRTAATFSIEAAAGMVEDSYSQPIETRMNFVPDSVTGNVHYSLLV